MSHSRSSINRPMPFPHRFPSNIPPAKPAQNTHAPIIPATLLRFTKTKRKPESRRQISNKNKASPTILPARTPHLADNLLSEYVSWWNGIHRGKIQQLDLFRLCTYHQVAYIDLARMYPLFWGLLKGRDSPDRVMKEEKAKAEARRESRLMRAFDVDNYKWGPLWEVISEACCTERRLYLVME